MGLAIHPLPLFVQLALPGIEFRLTGVQFLTPGIQLLFAFGLLGRTVSKINVFLLSLGARSFAGLALLGGAGVLLARYLLAAFERIPSDMLLYLPRP